MSPTGRPPIRWHKIGAGIIKGNARYSERGFTLLELMAVMALVALLVGLVLPNLLHGWERAGARANIGKLTAALRLARSEAATRGSRVRLFLNMKNGRFSVEGFRQQGELAGLRLAQAQLVWEDQDKTRGYVAFYGDGSSSGGKVVLEEPTGQKLLIEVKPITGRVDLAIQGK